MILKKSSSVPRTGEEKDTEEVRGAHCPPSPVCLSSRRRRLPTRTRHDRPWSVRLLSVSSVRDSRSPLPHSTRQGPGPPAGEGVPAQGGQRLADKRWGRGEAEGGAGDAGSRAARCKVIQHRPIPALREKAAEGTASRLPNTDSRKWGERRGVPAPSPHPSPKRKQHCHNNKNLGNSSPTTRTDPRHAHPSNSPPSPNLSDTPRPRQQPSPGPPAPFPAYLSGKRRPRPSPLLLLPPLPPPGGS